MACSGHMKEEEIQLFSCTHPNKTHTHAFVTFNWIEETVGQSLPKSSATSVLSIGLINQLFIRPKH